MTEGVKYSQIYLVNIVVENDWGYHLDSLWYGSETKNLALMIIDVMKSWYGPNKEVLGQSIREFHENLKGRQMKRTLHRFHSESLQVRCFTKTALS